MGQELIELIEESDEFTCTAIMDRQKLDAALDFPDFSSVDPDTVDAIIDFSSPDLLDLAAKWAMDHGKPLVTGTTGLEGEHFLLLQEASRVVPVLWAPNMSLGIAFLEYVCKNMMELSHYNFQIEEIHHNQKKDKPSGTAILLQNALKQSLGENAPPEPISIRGGGVFGVHKVYIMGDEETLTLEHQALNRRVFARGALKAAAWIVNQEDPGMYTISQVLGFEG